MLLLLHGFWGQPSDWDPFREELQRKGDSSKVFAPDLLSEGAFSPRHGLLGVCQNISLYLQRREDLADEPIDVIGYSMGGRLALHLAALFRGNWRRVWLLSTRPGIWSDHEVMQRRAWDHLWSSKFLKQDWITLEREWQELEVFTGTRPQSRRRESTETRELLSLALKVWSPAHHRFGLEELKGLLPQDTTWWFGEGDTKYLDVKTQMERQNIPGCYRIMPGIGHRLMPDAAHELADCWVSESKRGTYESGVY